MKNIKIIDILDRFTEIDIKSLTTYEATKILSNMKEKIINLTQTQTKNLIKFLTTLSETETIWCLMYLLHNEYDLSDDSKENIAVGEFLARKEFTKYRKTIYKNLDNNDILNFEISLIDILDNFDYIKHDVKNLTKDKTSEILSNMKEMTISELNKTQIDNLIKFLNTSNKDEILGYLEHVLDNEYSYLENKHIFAAAKDFLTRKEFSKFLENGIKKSKTLKNLLKTINKNLKNKNKSIK